MWDRCAIVTSGLFRVEQLRNYYSFYSYNIVISGAFHRVIVSVVCELIHPAIAIGRYSMESVPCWTVIIR